MTRADILNIIRAWAEMPFATYGDLLKMVAKANSGE